MKIGDKVRTNDYYMNHRYSWMFKSNPLKLGTIQKIENIDNYKIIHVKTANGRKRSLNELFIELI